MTNNIHLSNYYFDLNKRDTLSDNEKFIFSKLIGLANDLISKINNSNLENSLKEVKFKNIKSKITNCYSLSLAMEYYLDFEFELYKIDSKINEYCNLEYINKYANSDLSNKKTLTINTETKLTKLTSTNEDNEIEVIGNNLDNNSIIDFESKKIKDINFYINKYNLKINVNEDYILDVISNIR